MRQTFDSLSFILYGCPLDTLSTIISSCYTCCCMSFKPCCPVNVITQNLENCAFKLCCACCVYLADRYAVCCVAKQNIILAIIKLMRSFYTSCYLAVLNCECDRSGNCIACRSSCFSQCICAVIKILDLHVLVSH